MEVKESDVTVKSVIDEIQDQVSSNYSVLKSSITSLSQRVSLANIESEKMDKKISEELEELIKSVTSIRENQSLAKSRLNELYLHMEREETRRKQSREIWMLLRTTVSAILLMLMGFFAVVGIISMFS